MKIAFFFAALLVMLTASLFGQNINNTLGNAGTFTIKDGSTAYLTLSQADGYLGLTRSLTLPVTTGTTLGVIYKGSDRFIHDYAGAESDGYNTFVGINAGNFNLGGSLYTGSYNTAVGHSSLTSLTFGYWNSAVGYNALIANETGFANSAVGNFALSGNTEGSYNSAIGVNSLNSSTGNHNSAVGYYAGYDLTTGSNNTVIGYNAQVPSATSSNQVRIGDTYVTYAGVQVAWTVTSDRKWKSNIKESDLGLSFISKLNPVSYTRNNDEKGRIEYGLIAQELEEVLIEKGVENAGMLTIDDQGKYELRYNDLLAPMVKAIQELKMENDELRKELEETKVKVEGEMKEQIRREVRKVLSETGSSGGGTTKASFNESD